MDSTSPRYRWFVVSLLGVFMILNYAVRWALQSVFPLLEKEMGLNGAQEGWLLFAFGAAYGLCSPFAGFLVDRFGRKLVIFGSLCAWSAVCAGTAFATHFGVLLFFRVLEGATEAFYFPAAVSLISEYHDRNTRSRALGIHQAGLYVGIILGSVTTGFVAQFYGWRLCFAVFGVVGLIICVASYGSLIEPPRRIAESTERDQLWQCLRVLTGGPRPPLLIAAFLFSNVVGVAVLLQWMPLFLSDRFSLGLAATIATVFAQPASMLGAVLGGWRADRASQKWKMGRMLVQACALLLAAPFVYVAGLANSTQMLICVLVVWGLLKGTYDASIFSSMFDVTDPVPRDRIVGMMNMFAWIFAAAAGPVAGRWADHMHAIQHEALRSGFSINHAALGHVISMSSALYIIASLFLFLATWAFQQESKP
jgi:MFS family permease